MILFSVVIAVLCMATHTALVMFGQATVDAAAQDAMAVLQAAGTTEEQGREAAERTLALAPNLEGEVAVRVTTSEVEVYVTADVTNAFLGIASTVSASAGGPRERFYNEKERSCEDHWFFGDC